MVQIVFVDRGERRELDIRVNNPAVTVADLVAALDPAGAEAGTGDRTLHIGDRAADPDVGLTEAGLYDGAVVRLGDRRQPHLGPPTEPLTPVGRELVVMNGLNAGRRFPLTPGVVDIGRARGCAVVLPDTSVSKRHARLAVSRNGDVDISDLGSHNGTWVDGTPVLAPTRLDDGTPVRMGAVELELRSVHHGDRSLSVDPLRHTTAAGTIPFNRPPRRAPAPPPEPLDPPKPPNTNQMRTPLSLVGILAPLVFAGVMYLVWQNVMFLMFAGLSPVMAIGNFIDNRRRGKKSARSERERYRKELAQLERRLAILADKERARRAAAYPDPAEVVRRAALPSTSLWERRPTHPDFLQLRAGIGDVPWTPVAVPGKPADVPEELTALVREASTLRHAPVPLDLSRGGVVGIAGDRRAALALARSLVCQAAALHGAADLPMMVLTSPDARDAWDWVKWLPHVRDPSGAGRALSHDAGTSTEMVEARLRQAGPRDRTARTARAGSAGAGGGAGAGAGPDNDPPAGPALLVVLDDESLTKGRKAPARNLLRGDAGPVAGLVVASMTERLPALCTTVVELTDGDGQADLTVPHEAQRVEGFLAAGMDDEAARECARSLARFEDPELDVVGAGLPASIRLLPLLGLDECSPEAVLARWKAGGVDPPSAAPVGVVEDGVFALDMVADGPHALVGGTTGAGKSELLRTLVVGLASSVDPDHLTFVLIDFKGGSAFDECARLPHTVGLVTDLDEHLAERALRCLEAELKYRERVLRDAGAIDLPDYLRSRRAGEPLPRLLVIIDEFATLKAELPDFIDALVGVAQRGRSLGVHLLLATQRPQGAISDNIKANTNLRIALRMQDPGESTDVIDVPDAAAIPRTAPGRAYVRLGPGEVVAVQSALVTGARSHTAPPPVDADLFVFGPQPRVTIPRWGETPDDEAADGSPTDLAVLVDAIDAAFARTGRPAPRRPWPEPLHADVALEDVITQAVSSGERGPGDGDATREAREAREGGGRSGSRLRPASFVPLALADDPDAQDQYPTGWVPSEGNLLVYGIVGSGTTTTLASLALALAATDSPDDLHIYLLDFGAGELAALEPLPHVGAVILTAERERQTRLVRHLRAEMDRRRDLGTAARRREPTIVTMIDGWSALAAEHDDVSGERLMESLTRVIADGPELGMYTVVTADRANAVPGRVASLVRQRLVLRLSDAADYGAMGIRMAAVPDMVPGRAIVSETGQVVQIARPAGGVAAAAARLAAQVPAPTRPPPAIATLAATVAFDSLGEVARLEARPWTIPVGVAEETLAPARLLAYHGEHVLITGPARSGKSTALLTIAAACRHGHPGLRVIAVTTPRSPLVDEPLIDETVPVGPAAAEALTSRIADVDTPVLVLFDDAEAIDDPDGGLARLARDDHPHLLIAAAARHDSVRVGGLSHWTARLRRARLGVLLQPDIHLDGEILGAKLPLQPPVTMTTGRGYLVNGGVPQLVQMALP